MIDSAKEWWRLLDKHEKYFVYSKFKNIKNSNQTFKDSLKELYEIDMVLNSQPIK